MVSPKNPIKCSVILKPNSSVAEIQATLNIMTKLDGNFKLNIISCILKPMN